MTKKQFLFLCNIQLDELNTALKGGEYSEDSLLVLFFDSGMCSVYPIDWDGKNKEFYLNESRIEICFALASKAKEVDFILV